LARISIIVPVLDDRAALVRLLAEIPPDPDLELIVADGGSDAELDRIVPPRGHLVRAAPGRARQMNAGAAAAMGEWLLFLHADSTLPPDWHVRFLAGTEHAEAGWFQFALDDPAWQARLIERGVRLRVRWLRLPYGDQGLFVRRAIFERLGGYRDLPIMEDVELVRRLTRTARCVELPLPLATSARRWRRDGWVRRSGTNMLLLALYFAGVAPSRLARWYG
jgi:rSAM/selenodomain-associated transferase 2